MGIEIYPQTLKSGLLKVNIQLNQAVENAQPYIKSIKEFIGTDQLDSIAFGSQKDYMNRGHLMAVKSQIQAMEAVISANQRHINLIDCYLEGETYVSEEALQEQLKNVRKIQWIAQDLKLSEICDVMYELEQYIQAKIEKLYEYEQAQRGLYDSALTAIATAELYGSALHGAAYNSGTGMYVLPLSVLRKADKNRFYNCLPKVLWDYISMDDFEITDDGFFLCKKNMKDIMQAMGLSGKETLNGVEVSAYDDWYLSGIINSKGKVTYTLIKMREPTDNQDARGSAVPFVSLDMKNCENIFRSLKKNKKLTKKEKTQLGKLFYSVTNADGDSKANKTLLNYFKNPASQGSYLLADYMVNKVVNGKGFNDNGVYKVPTGYEENDKYCKKKLDKLSEAGVYDKKKNTIRIKDRSNLTKDEYDAILMIMTGNPDKYAYAAENQYHAVRHDSAFGLFKKHTIISDAGVGESKWNYLYEDRFKSESGKFYKEQVEAHKEK